MNAIDVLVRHLTASADLLKMTFADFSDAELSQRPCDGANHPLWQLGHLCSAELFFANMVKPGSMPELPAGFSDRFSNKMNVNNDPKHFAASKQELIDLFTKVRAATIAMVKTLTPEDLAKPAPEKMRSMCPTMADLLVMQSFHPIMHMGQVQVARRKLGKPVLF